MTAVATRVALAKTPPGSRRCARPRAGHAHASLVGAALAVVGWSAAVASAELMVSSDFPGGSAEVVTIDQDGGTIEVAPTLHYGHGWPCWWYFRVDGAAGDQPITVKLHANRQPFRGQERLAPAWALPRQASLSADNDQWRDTPEASIADGVATYQFAAPGETFWLAWGPPFLLSHADALLDEVASAVDGAERFTLAQTRDGNPVPAIRLGNRQAPHAVWVQARQHAWETGSSWVADGLARWIASDAPEAIALRDNAEIVFVPIMDVDNVQRGAGGKNADPRDHNRDWADEPIYPEVAAAQQQIGALVDAGRLRVYLDLHNPGAGSRQPFYFGPLNYDQLPAELRQRYDRFLRLSTQQITDPVALLPKFRFATYVQTQEERNRVSRMWVANRGDDSLVSLTLETSWDTPQGNVPGYRLVGRGLARTLAEYLGSVDSL